MRRLSALVAFAIAMGYLESAVVVYLRHIYYPQGFGFPLVGLDATIALTEIGREVATLIMLMGIGWLAGRSRLEKFSFFLISFAVWDLFYYIFLWLLLDWPPSLLTWDILFLIPVMWIGPVLAPVLLSITMVGLAGILLRGEQVGPSGFVLRAEWLLFIAGSVLAIVSFTWECSAFMVQQGGWSTLWSIDAASSAIRERYIPAVFPWWLFWLAEGVIVAGIVRILIRIKRAEST